MAILRFNLDRTSLAMALAVAVGAAIVGSIAGAMLQVIYAISTHTSFAHEGWAVAVGITPVIAFFALIFALPCSLLIGTPIVLLCAKLIVDHPGISGIATSLVGAIVGAGLSMKLTQSGISSGRIEMPFIIFGIITAAMHVLIVLRFRKQLFPAA